MKKSALLPLLLLLAIPHLASGQDASVRKKMESATVKILCPISETRTRTGSGVILGDARHVVTNFHVAGDVACLIALGERDIYRTKVVAADQRKDLVVLETEKDLPRQPIREAEPHSSVNKGDRVYVMGFPGAAEIRGIQAESTYFEVKVTSGIISAFVKSDAGTELYQTDATIHPGNSGGPLFNQCGQLIAINVAKSSAGEGIGYSIVFDELRPLLKTANIASKVDEVSSACVLTAPVDWFTRGLLILAIAMGSAGVVLASTRRGRKAVVESVKRMTEPRRMAHHPQGPLGGAVPPPPPPGLGMRLALRGVAGQYSGTEIPLDDRPLVMGRDPRQCQLVFPPETDSISKRHCVLRYRSAAGTLEIEDCGSTNGTFVNSGEQIRPGQPRPLRVGDRFSLGDTRNQFEVRAASQPYGS